ncbi:MAG: hypothetical protein Ta2G_17450 [Termitinemataceae bacterium]|nr:MAG: hypothetical protein Ta2G_17450 [Termitinemataceae bacterium]
MGRRRLKLGDIYAIPLPDGAFAFGRLYEEYALAIYKERTKDINILPKSLEYDFFVGVYSDLLKDGEWVVVGNIPFANDEDAWTPPTFIKDPINGKFSLYHHGKITPATREECEGLEVASAWDRHHVIDRLMGDLELTNKLNSL